MLSPESILFVILKVFCIIWFLSLEWKQGLSIKCWWYKRYSVIFDFWALNESKVYQMLVMLKVFCFIWFRSEFNISKKELFAARGKVGSNWRGNEKQSNKKTPFDETLRTDWKTLKVFIFAAFCFIFFFS